MSQKFYFLALDKNDNEDLWVTDGTTTQAVGGLVNIGVSGASNEGLGPEYITAFDDEVIFAGEDALDDTASNGIWLSNGEASGTTEVGGVSPGSGKSSPFINGNPNGLNPTDFVSFGKQALFFGTDAANFTGLWVTNGTPSGTVELGGLENGTIVGRGTNWDPTNFAAFNDDVLFDAYDSSGSGEYIGLWITNGTTGGTVEIGGLQNAAIYDSGESSFEATDFITLGDVELFNAPNKEGDAALWITDGTANGTVEIGGVNNAGIGGADNTNLGDGLAQAVRFGDRIFFAGTDNDNATGLWTTNGTASGTLEVGGLRDAGIIGQHPSSIGLNPTDLTVNGQQVLFNGVDAIGFQELWASNGSATGTYEIGGEGVGGELAHEASDGVNPNNIVSLGNGLAVFIGYDDSNGQASGKATLWVTDGTYSGTEEIGGLDNLSVGGINSTGFDFTGGLTGGSGLAYFVGEDTDGNNVLWETNGTLGGTKIVTASDGNAPATGLMPENGGTMGPPPVSVTDVSGGGKVVNLESVPGENVDLSDTDGTWDTVTGSNGSINLDIAQAFVYGGGVLLTLTSIGNAVSLYNTNGNADSIYGSKGAITLNGVLAEVFGGDNKITFAPGTTGNVVYLSGTDGNWDSVTGSNGTIAIANAQASVTGGSDTIDMSGASSVSLYSTGGNWDAVYGSDQAVTLNAAQASVTGGGNTIYSAGASTASLYGTSGNWDAFQGSGATVIVNSAQASIIGGGDTIYLNGASSVSLSSTAGSWDAVYGSNATIIVSASQAAVIGGGDTLYLNGASSVSLSGTSNNWDAVYGSGQTVITSSAQASVIGGGDTLYLNGASTISLSGTKNNWDAVYGSKQTVITASAQAAIIGGGDTLYLNGASSVSLSGTNNNWDAVYATGQTVITSSAQAAIVGGGDTLYLNGASSVSLAGSNNNWDAVYGSNQTEILNSIQGTLIGNGNDIYLGGANTFTLSGSSEHLFTGQALGQDWIVGFGSSDTMQFSAADFANYSVLQSHMSQPGSDTIITLNATNSVTLYGVSELNLQFSQFSFV